MIAAAKAELRRWARAERARLGPEERVLASAEVRRHLHDHLHGFGDVSLAGYWPLGDEVDLRPLLVAWHAQGRRALLPRVVRPREPLRFHRWTPATVLEPAAFGMEEPPADAPVEDPDVLLVPGLLIDHAGYRLGYGGGFYDRTLALLRPQAAIGVVFEAQVVARLPHDGFDQRLSHLATERGVRPLPLAHP